MEKNHNRFVAFFDLLGFSEFVRNNSIETVLRVFGGLFKTIATSWYRQLEQVLMHMATKRLWGGETVKYLFEHLERMHKYIVDGQKISFKEFSESTLNNLFPLKASIFSDSIIIYSDTVSDSNQRLAGFEIIVSLAREFIRNAFLGRIATRGAVAFGEFYIDEQNSTYFGKALLNAVRLEKEQEWIGCCLDQGMVDVYNEYIQAWVAEGKPVFWEKTFLGPALSRHTIDKYPVPMKGGSNKEMLIINWCGAIIGKVNINNGFFDNFRTGHPEIDIKFDNTLCYLKWWESELKQSLKNGKLIF